MAEYIEREALIADIEKRYCRPCEAEGKDYNHVRCRACWVDDMVGEIEQAVDAEVVPVVHGRWVGLEYDGYADGCPVYDLWECSECGEEEKGEDVPATHPWCHGCGARMDGEA